MAEHAKKRKGGAAQHDGGRAAALVEERNPAVGSSEELAASHPEAGAGAAAAAASLSPLGLPVSRDEQWVGPYETLVIGVILLVALATRYYGLTDPAGVVRGS